MDTWHDVGQAFYVEDKVRRIRFFREKNSFFWFRNRQREKGEERASKCFSLRSSEFRRSEFVEPRVKVHLLDMGYAWVQKKKRDFTKDPKEEISGNQNFQD